MRTIYKIPLAFVFAIALFTPFSCTDGFDELNTNPKLVTDELIKPELLLTKVLKRSSFEIQNSGTVAEYSGYLKRGDSGQLLIFRTSDSPFDYYIRHIASLQAIIKLTKDKPELANKNAIARIWRVWVFHRMTDAYGDIPYSEVARSFDDITYYPAYDTQEAIYQDLLNELKEAAGQLSEDAEQKSYGDADVLYQSDAMAWKRFANSLRLRLAMRVRYADQSLAQTHISDVFGAELISDNSQNATISSEGEGAADLANTNPLYQNFVNQSAGAGNAISAGLVLVENLLNTNDPRLEAYVKQNNEGDYRGGAINMTLAQKEQYPQVSKYTDRFIQAEYDFRAMTAAEVSFLKAEAVLAGLASGNANDLFQQGIEQAMELYDIDAADVNTFLASAAGSLAGTSEEQLEQIITQKYLALFGDSYEAWAEHRRTGYPRIWTGAEAAPDTDGHVARRLAYPLGEYNLNTEKVKAAAARIGGDLLKSRIWWDAKPGVPFDHPKQGTFPPY